MFFCKKLKKKHLIAYMDNKFVTKNGRHIPVRRFDERFKELDCR